MGDNLVSSLFPDDEDNEQPTRKYYDVFYEQFPFYLSIGMTYELYWNGDSSLVKYYRDAFLLQRDRKNEELWLQGMYVYEALCDVSPILRAFVKKGTKPIEYSTRPYAITEKEIERRKQEKLKAAYDKIKAKMSSFAVRFNANTAKDKNKGG